MSGIESLIDKSVRAGMVMANQAFASGGQVQGYATGGAIDYYDDGSTIWDLSTTDPSLIDWNGAGEYFTAAPEPYTGPAVADPDTAFTSPMATTQPVGTSGVKYSDPAPTMQDWYDLGLWVEGGGNMQVPEFRRSDWAYYDAQGEPTIQINTGGGDSGDNWVTQANPNYRPAGYYLTPEARARLGDQWTKEDNTSIAWGGNGDYGDMTGGDYMGQTFTDYWSRTGSTPTFLTTRPTYDFAGNVTGSEMGYYDIGGDNPQWHSWSPSATTQAEHEKQFNDWWDSQTGVTAMVKTADKGGTPVYWVRQGDRMVPVQLGGQMHVDTNNDWTVPAIAFASLGAAAYLTPVAAAEAGAVGAGTSAAEAFALSDAVYGASQFGYGAAAAEAAAASTLGVTAAEAAQAGFVFDAAQGVWIAPTTTIVGSAAPALTAAEIAAGVGTVGAASQLPVFESNYPTDVFEEGFTPSEANPVSGPETPPPFEEGFIPSEANPVSGPTPSTGIPPGAQRVIDWAIEHPEAVLTGVGVVGGLLEDPDSGGGGGVSAAGGWNQPINQRPLGRSYTPAPEGYRPGFSPEHQYIDYMLAPQANVVQPPTSGTTSGGGGNPGPDYAMGGQVGFASGGIAALHPRQTKGPGDGMSDSIPATIDGQQDAALSTDEFVVPADVVSDLGNGSSDAGAQVLYAMVDRIRQARHGTKEQPPEIDPGQFLPA